MEYTLNKWTEGDHNLEVEEIWKIVNGPNSLFRKMDGKKFWELMDEIGHSSIGYNNCKCKKIISHENNINRKRFD